jgi:hypothetical protein
VGHEDIDGPTSTLLVGVGSLIRNEVETFAW